MFYIVYYRFYFIYHIVYFIYYVIYSRLYIIYYILYIIYYILYVIYCISYIIDYRLYPPTRQGVTACGMQCTSQLVCSGESEGLGAAGSGSLGIGVVVLQTSLPVLCPACSLSCLFSVLPACPVLFGPYLLAGLCACLPILSACPACLFGPSQPGPCRCERLGYEMQPD